MKKPFSPLKYYVYISDSKVEMLFQQIPQEIKSKLATELKFSLKILEATFKQDAPVETKISRLKIVSEYLEKHSDIGTIDKPGEYFKGHMTMKWGPWLEWATGSEAGNKMVWFTGENPHTIVGLGGSLRNVIGHMRQENIPDSYSNLAYILGLLANELELPNESFTRRTGESELRREALSAVEFALDLPRVPSQSLEFLAKTLLVGPTKDRSRHIVVGSPIYVAMV